MPIWSQKTFLRWVLEASQPAISAGSGFHPKERTDRRKDFFMSFDDFGFHPMVAEGIIVRLLGYWSGYRVICCFM